MALAVSVLRCFREGLDAVSQRAAVNLALIEADYRAGVLSLRAIAKRHGCSEGAVRKWAKKAVDAQGEPAPWSRDLKPQVRERAESILAQDPAKSAPHVRAAVRTPHPVTQIARTDFGAHDAVLIETGARAIVRVVETHRSALARAKQLTLTLLDQLESESDRKSQAPATLSVRAAALRHLVASLQVLVLLERDVYGVATCPEVSSSPALAPADAEARRRTFDEIRQRVAAYSLSRDSAASLTPLVSGP
jgi:hypothetical protein